MRLHGGDGAKLHGGDGAKLHGGDDTNPAIPYTITKQLGWAAVNVNKHSPVNLECMASALREKNLQTLKKNLFGTRKNSEGRKNPIPLKHPKVRAKYSNINKSSKQSMASSSSG